MTKPVRPASRRRPLFAGVRSSFFTGLVVILPIGLTGWVIWSLTGFIDGVVLPVIPAAWQPEQYIGINLRGVGVIFFLVFTATVGWLAKGYMGRSLIRWGEGIVAQMPVVRSIYNGLKQIAETVLSQGEEKFDRACMIEYPRKGMWAVAFVSSSAKGEVAEAGTPEDPLISVFLPTTPNPTSGFLLFLPRSQVRYLDMSVEDAAKLIISAGLVYPNAKPAAPPPRRGGAPRPGRRPAAAKLPAARPEKAASVAPELPPMIRADLPVRTPSETFADLVARFGPVEPAKP
ncbi:DUF502 domain-containing protein [Phaeovulum vinaykumarii]|uniref:Uncharacterized membrane protein n=1 Tax=Phaeovulum vinaykumarii TaxID=407234 RepID=A0A1N7L836_9RHOB|nr:Uncharacterized membrane protein [Phaeovulum vinaykumarii]SOB99190.1 uncharacterized membrane protein [Phaeovulum vinaykumarii]